MLHHSQSGLRLRRDSDGEVTAMLRRGHWCLSLPCWTCRWTNTKQKEEPYYPSSVSSTSSSSSSGQCMSVATMIWHRSRRFSARCRIITLIMIALIGWRMLHAWSRVRSNAPLTFTLGGVDIDSVQLQPFDDALQEQLDNYLLQKRQLTFASTTTTRTPRSHDSDASGSGSSSDGTSSSWARSSRSSGSESSNPSTSTSSRGSPPTSGSSNNNGVPSFNRPNAMFENRIVHIDMKGLPPRPSWLASIMPWLALRGATGILMEWEDMLPYYGELAALRSTNAYTPADVSLVLDAAHANGLTVIPLVPTFGNLEFVLKHRQFAFLREVPTDVRAVCPTQAKVILQLQLQSYHTPVW
jgi:hypothetical protein